MRQVSHGQCWAARFRQYLGEPPVAYLTRWRLQLGAQVLSSTTYSVAQTASKVGYDSEQAFNRAFKRNFGDPPARYRNQTKSKPKQSKAAHGCDSGTILEEIPLFCTDKVRSSVPVQRDFSTAPISGMRRHSLRNGRLASTTLRQCLQRLLPPNIASVPIICPVLPLSMSPQRSAQSF